MLPIYNIILGDEGQMNAVALVADPAIEINFMTFNKEENTFKFSFSEDRHEIYGPVAVPDLLIYRFSEQIGDYYVKFSKEVIEEMILKYSKDNLFNSLNFNHIADDKVNNVYLIESFLKNTNKGISPVEFEDCPDGTWFVKFKVCDDDLWNTLKTSDKFKGFSLEGMFSLEEAKEEPKEEPKTDDLDDILNDIYKN